MNPYIQMSGPDGEYSVGPFIPSPEPQLWTCPSPEGTLIAQQEDDRLLFLGVVHPDCMVFDWSCNRYLKGPEADRLRRAAGVCV